MIAPLTHGLTMVVDEADYEAERWYRIIRDEHITVCTRHQRRYAC